MFELFKDGCNNIGFILTMTGEKDDALNDAINTQLFCMNEDFNKERVLECIGEALSSWLEENNTKLLNFTELRGMVHDYEKRYEVVFHYAQRVDGSYSATEKFNSLKEDASLH